MTEQSNGEMLRASKEFYRRYTKVEYALEILRQNRLKLRPIDGWEDQNDKRCLGEYAKRKGHTQILAACVTDGLERYHHWTGYDGRDELCCITLKKPLVKAAVLISRQEFRGLIFSKVHYISLTAAQKTIKLRQLPFRKYSAYRAEQEWRFLYGSHRLQSPIPFINISPEMVANITLSPWLDDTKVNQIRTEVQAIKGFESHLVSKSLVIENEKWLQNVLSSFP